MITNVANIEEYYNEVKDQYDIDLEHFKFICNTPFRFVKKIMSSGVLSNIRIQYLGTFEVSPSRVRFSKKSTQENYDLNLISKVKYESKMKILNSYET